MRILIMDDDADDVMLIHEHIKQVLPDAVIDAKIIAFSEPRDYLNYDLIIMDERVGPFYGSEICALIRKLGFNKNIILISGFGEVMKNFNYFVDKNHMGHLVDILRKEYLPDTAVNE